MFFHFPSICFFFLSQLGIFIQCFLSSFFFFLLLFLLFLNHLLHHCLFSSFNLCFLLSLVSFCINTCLFSSSFINNWLRLGFWNFFIFWHLRWNHGTITTTYRSYRIINPKYSVILFICGQLWLWHWSRWYWLYNWLRLWTYWLISFVKQLCSVFKRRQFEFSTDNLSLDGSFLIFYCFNILVVTINLLVELLHVLEVIKVIQNKEHEPSGKG